MKLYVIRHGESENNLTRKWTGWFDAALTEKGQEDARKAASIIGNIPFDKIYTSDLQRAINTAKIALPGCTYETTPMIREINVGTLAGHPFSCLTPEQRARIPQQGYLEFNGETTQEFTERIQRFLNLVKDSPYETVAAFAHGGVLRTMLDHVVGLKLPRNTISCNNCTVAVFEYQNELWCLHSWMNL